MLIDSGSSALPRLARVRQRLVSAALDRSAIVAAVQREFAALDLGPRLVGRSVAIGAGSRGIANYALVVGTVAGCVRAAGGRPFIFPAMGSHGGATPDGQRAVLATHGITEPTMGCPIISDLAVDTVGHTARGLPVYLDRHANAADALIVINRVKAHTNFRGPVESGLCKMLAIGCGKHAQALAIHNHGVTGLRDDMPEVARVVLASGKVAAGFAIVEDGHHQTARIAGVAPADFHARESQLLVEAKRLSPRLPVDACDLLIVERIGKDISGTGMDTNVIGRCRLVDFAAFPTPVIKIILALSLSADTHGNAIGMGLADLVTRRLADAVDRRTTNVNCITGHSPGMGALPIVADTDHEAVRLALDFLLGPDAVSTARIIRIRDTLNLGEMEVSERVLGDLRGREGIEVIGELATMRFAPDGALI